MKRMFTLNRKSRSRWMLLLLLLVAGVTNTLAQNVTIHPGNGSTMPCKKDIGGDGFFAWEGSATWMHEQLPLTLTTGDSDNNLTNNGNQLTRSGQLANPANNIFASVNASVFYITYESEGTTYYLNYLNNQLRFTTEKTTTWEVNAQGYVHSGSTYLGCNNSTGNDRTLSIVGSNSSRRLRKDNDGHFYYQNGGTTLYLHGTTSASTTPTVTNDQNGLAEWTEETGDYLQIGKGNAADGSGNTSATFIGMDTYVTIGLPSGYRITGYTITFHRIDSPNGKPSNVSANDTGSDIAFGETDGTFTYRNTNNTSTTNMTTYRGGISQNTTTQYTIGRTSQSDTDMGNVLYFKLSNNRQQGRAFIQLDYVELRFTAEYDYPPLTPGNPVFGKSAVDVSFTTGKMDYGELTEQRDGNGEAGYDDRISYNGRLHDLTGNLTLYEYGSVTGDQDNKFDGTVGKMVDYIDGSITSAGEYFKLDVSEHNHMKLDERQNISASEKQDTAIYFIESPVWLVNGGSDSQHKNPVGYRIVKASFDCATTTNVPTQFQIQIYDADDGWGGSTYGLNYYSGQYNYNYQTIWSIDSEGYIYYSIFYLSVVNGNVVVVTEKPTAANGTFEIVNNQIRRKNYTNQYIGWEKTTTGQVNRSAVITTTTNNRATYNQVSSAHTESVGNFTFLIYDKTGKYVAKEVSVTGNTTLSIDSLNNDAVKIGVIGSGLIKGNLTLQALDPYIERLSIVCQENSGNSGGRVSQQFNAKDFSVKGGTFLFQVPSDFQGDAKFTFENLYSNYGDNTYYNETHTPERHSRYYFVGSTYGNYDSNDVYARYKNHSDADYTTKVACSNPGNIKYIFNNADTVVNDGGYYKQFPFTLAKYAAKGGNFTPFIFPSTSMNNTATKTAYLFTADETRYNIAPTTGTQHVSYAYYEMTIKMDKIDYYPYLTWTKIYDETFYSADNSNIKRDSKWGLTLTTTANSQNTEMGTHSGYLTVSSILDYIKGRATTGTVGQNGYIPLGSTNAPTTMDQILYIDASQLESIMETTTNSLSSLKDSLDVNTLIYLPYGSQSQLENVASNMTAKYTDAKSFRSANNIVVTDRYPFYAPYDIQVDASKIAKYERTLTNSQLYGDDDQHLTIVLPFEINVDASGVHTNTDGQGSPFSLATMNRTNSLSKKTGSMINFYKDGADGYFTTISEKSEANKPYVVTMQGDAGESAFKVHQTGALVKATPNTTGIMTGEGPCTGTYTYKENDVEKTVNYTFTHKGTYTGIEIGVDGNGGAATASTTVFYFANNLFLDSKSLANAKSLKMLPYRSYYEYTSSGAPAKLMRFSIVFGENDDNNTTGINEVQKNSNLAIIPGNGYITIMAKADSNVAIHTVNGMAVEKCNLRAGETRTVAMPSGIYVINGVKMVVK